MAYFETCPLCGANLDPDERCDCNKDKEILKKIVIRTKEGLKNERNKRTT